MTFVKGRVVARREWAARLWSLTFEAAAEPHEPGQFLNIGLTVDGQMVRRAYSLASAPGAPLELYLVVVPGGALTPALYRLAIGDELEVDPRPHGFFVPSELPAARDLWLIGTGTGLGPYLAMLRHGAIFERFERITLVHGVRDAGWFGYQGELEALERARPAGFRYLRALSRGEAAGALSGRITDLCARGELERAAERAFAADASHVMLCGNPEMIADMQRLLAERGLKKHRRREPGHVTVEKYW